MLAHLFPGQGSQFRGMGRELFSRFKSLVSAANTILGYSVEALCLEDAHDRLGDTRFVQPAIYVVNAMSYLQREAAGEAPSFVAGHSLGEYSALFASRVFDFETGLRLVQQRAELMASCSDGAMAAVAGCGVNRVRELLEQHDLLSLDIANYNAEDQQVLSGPQADILRAKSAFRAAKISFARLKVSGPFHSRYMTPARKGFERVLKEVSFAQPRIPVIGNVIARPYEDGEVRFGLAMQLDNPVRWVDSIRYLLRQGVTEFVEVGPGSVLTKLMATISGQQEYNGVVTSEA